MYLVYYILLRQRLWGRNAGRTRQMCSAFHLLAWCELRARHGSHFTFYFGVGRRSWFLAMASRINARCIRQSEGGLLIHYHQHHYSLLHLLFFPLQHPTFPPTHTNIQHTAQALLPPPLQKQHPLRDAPPPIQRMFPLQPRQRKPISTLHILIVFNTPYAALIRHRQAFFPRV